jgi:CRP-like cAMP-binding protein
MTSSNHQIHNSRSFEKSSFNEQLHKWQFRVNEIIPSRNDILLLIESGAVRTGTWSEEGTFITLGYWGTGDVIGYPLSKVNPYEMQCVGVTQVTILAPHLWYKYINNLLSYSQHTEQLLSIVNCKGVPLRMWLFLVYLSEKFGRDVEVGKQIDLKITHQDMAEALNTTRVTVTRLLKKFEKEGKILRRKRKIILITEN